jgi:hypothetical protein
VDEQRRSVSFNAMSTAAELQQGDDDLGLGDRCGDGGLDLDVFDSLELVLPYTHALALSSYLVVRERAATETNRISAGENPTLCTSEVVLGGLHVQSPVSVMPEIHTEK